jgi:hypothetical protein
MNTPLSLVQELRGIRGGQKQGNSDAQNLLSEIREARREWQEQVDQAQQLLHELLAAVADLSGVQLPGMEIGTGKDGEGSLRLGFKTLKDRIQNELEGFASTSAAEVAKKFQGKSSVVFEPLEKEMSARMDNLADEFRGKLQTRLEAEQNGVAEKAKVRTEEMLQSKMDEFAEWIKLMTEGAVSSIPAEVQRSLEPHVEQVKDRLKNTFQQHLNMVVLEAERAALGKVEEIKKEVQGLVGGLSEQARQACLQSTDQAMKDFNMRIGAVAQESTRQLEAGTRAYADENLNNFKAQLTGLSVTSKEEFQTFADSNMNGYKEKLLAAAQELQQKSAADIANNVQKASQDALNSSLSQVKQRIDEALEQSKGELKSTMGTMVEDVRKQMSDSAASARDSLAGDASTLSAELKSLGEQLKSSENQRITAMTDSMASLSRQALERHSQTIKQVADSQIEEIQKSLSGLETRMAMDYEAQLRQFIGEQRKAVVEEIQRQVADASTNAVEKIRSSSGQVVQDLSGKVNKEVNTATTLLNQWAHQTTTWAEASIKESLESYKRQVAEFTSDLMQEQRTTIQSSIGDLQGRLEQAANLLRVADGAVSETRRVKDHQQA